MFVCAVKNRGFIRSGEGWRRREREGKGEGRGDEKCAVLKFPYKPCSGWSCIAVVVLYVCEGSIFLWTAVI